MNKISEMTRHKTCENVLHKPISPIFTMDYLKGGEHLQLLSLCRQPQVSQSSFLHLFSQ